jgi:bifunctional DNA-binding transcriptional regulator/antitoxin component of YhaV-PrlF toxin-antitoxin module
MSNDEKNISYEVEVNHRGQIMIPAFFREALELSPQDQLRMSLKADGKSLSYKKLSIIFQFLLS